ncbi:Dicer-like protein 2 [Aspergillus hancockii]|nr:Dicer-like protein 2 [Aspergillus hancockii]
MAKALVGAAFLGNGMDQAATCIAPKIPKVKSWNASSLYDEAMTHPSCVGIYGTTSYRRLSFLGASVIEWVVAIYSNLQEKSISCQKLQSETEHKAIEVDDKGSDHVIHRKYRVAICNFLRSHSDKVSAKVSKLTQGSSKGLSAIHESLWVKGIYPWARLSNKELSDILQGIFGAKYIDSGASLQRGEILAERLGILPLLEHLISHDVVTDHPKDTLQLLLPRRKVSYRFYEAEKRHMATKCGVIVDGSEIATVEGQTTRGALIIRAMEEAVRLLTNTPWAKEDI